MMVEQTKETFAGQEVRTVGPVDKPLRAFTKEELKMLEREDTVCFDKKCPFYLRVKGG